MSEPLEIEEVFWRDSASFCFSWKETAQFDKDQLASTICQTAGYLLLENEQDVVIAQNLGDYGNKDEQILSVIVIPKVCITKRVRLKRQGLSK